jgi:hypothetical protein
MAPAIVRDVGDVAQIASLIAPRPVIIAGGVTGAGKPVGMAALREEFKFTTQVYSLMTPEGETRLQVVSPDDVVGLLRP